MKIEKSILLFALLIHTAISFANEKAKALNERLIAQNTEIIFLENKGQVFDQNYISRPDILFSGHTNRMVFHLKTDGISYQFNRINSCKEMQDKYTGSKSSGIAQSSIYRVDINWLNTNNTKKIHKGEPQVGFNNYYNENFPNGVLNVMSYHQITYQNIYDGIDLKWYSNDGVLKYDYLVSAGANHLEIQYEIKGAESIFINKKGELEIKTPLGTIIEDAPYVSQEGIELKSQWVVNNNKISFDIKNINPTKPFIIDPIVRHWGTYYGGDMNDVGTACATDPIGNIYLTGFTETTSSTLIATSGSHQSTHNGGSISFLVQFNSFGERQWGTYYGGSGYDISQSCSVDNFGNVFIAGYTEIFSGAAIATSGSHQSTHGGGIDDAFLVKFNSSGIRLWGTYYGGTGDERGNSCFADPSGNIYLAGYTASSTGAIIATPGSHQSTFGGGPYDAFLVKFNSDGIRQWGTYYGGSGGYDIGHSVTVDDSGNVYMAGRTSTVSGFSIATPSSHQNTHGGDDDAFLVKFNSSGIRQWGTYIGGAGTDHGYSCAVDYSGNVYLAGNTRTTSTTEIATLGSHQSIHGGNWDAFLVQFNASGQRQWGTYYGGVANENGNSCAVDPNGNVYLAGDAGLSTGTIIATSGSHQNIHEGGTYDAFLAIFNSAGIRQWGTYYGGALTDQGESCAIDISGNIYLAGSTSSNSGTFIATSDSHQSMYGGASKDAFLVKFNSCLTPPSQTPYITGDTIVCSGSSLNYSVSNDLSASSYTWTLPDGWSGNSNTNSINVTVGANGGVISVIANNICGSSTIQTLDITVISVAPPLPSSITGDTTVCNGTFQNYTVNNDPFATSYTWSLPVSWTGIGITNSINSIAGTISGTISVTANNACGNSAPQTLYVNVNSVPSQPTNITGSVSVCVGDSQNYSVTIDPFATSYTWSLPVTWTGTSTTNSINSIVGISSGTISVTADNVCGNSIPQTLNVNTISIPSQPSTISGSMSVCEGNLQNYSVTNDPFATSYTWSLPATWIGTSTTNSINSITGTTDGTISVTANNACGNSTTQTLNVSVNLLPTVTLSLNATNVCIDNAVFAFSGGFPLGGTYSGNGVSTGNFNAAIAGVGINTITYSFTDGNGCTNTSTDQITVDNCTELVENTEKEFFIYPNPTEGTLHLISSEKYLGSSVVIFDILGNIVLSSYINSTHTSFDISTFSSGLYFIECKNEKCNQTFKIIKK